MGYVINKHDHGINIALIGCGGFGREVYHHIKHDISDINVQFYVDDAYASAGHALPVSQIDFINSYVIVAIGDPKSRKNIIDRLPANCKYATFIHSSVVILDNDNVNIGDGNIICAGTILTTNISLGNHVHLNLNTTIGHDVILGDFVTTAPAVNISGNCIIGQSVYFGTNSSVKEKIKICDDAIIGMNAAIVKDIDVAGTYVGIPAKLLTFK